MPRHTDPVKQATTLLRKRQRQITEESRRIEHALNDLSSRSSTTTPRRRRTTRTGTPAGQWRSKKPRGGTRKRTTNKK